ncbi:MAG: hypothetical protein LBK43_08080 [Treponema sp.]|jgi:hypothetical protein|nr:hypothetical protein [Treponema sp.]
MKKKLVAVCIIGLFLGTIGAFAEHPDGLGLGIVGRGGWGGFGPALSLKIPSLPVYWAVNLGISQHYFGVGITGDYYLIDKALVPDINLDWYFGFGGYLGLGSWKDGYGYNDHDGFAMTLGLRAPIGLSWEFLEHFELFGDIFAGLGFGIVPFYFPDWDIGGEIGIRYWF